MRAGAMQAHGAARRILERPHGEREGAAREGRGRERRGQRQVRVCLRPLLDGPSGGYTRRQGYASFRLEVYVSAPCRKTPLHLASSYGKTESVKALLEKGADVNAEDKDKCAFACSLCWMGDGYTRRQGYASFRLEVYVSAPCRKTPLHLASSSGHTESVKALLEKGADVNAEDKDRCADLYAPNSSGDGCRGGSAWCGSWHMCRRHAGAQHCTWHQSMATRRA
jgi:hypothetical protein